jgi:hypothetical protein
MTEPLLHKTLVHADRIRSFQIDAAPAVGWEASERINEQIVQRQRYTEWHRVERTMSRFTRAIEALRDQGWREA